MSNDSSFNKDQYTKRTSTFILPTKRNKKSRTSKTTNEEANINNRSPIFIDLDEPLTDSSTTVKQLYGTESSHGIDQNDDLDSDDDAIDMTESKHRSLDMKENTSTNYIDLLLHNNGDEGDSDPHIIDLTDSTHSNTTTNSSPPRPAPSIIPTPDSTPLDTFKEQGAASPPPPLQLDVTPKAANESNKADLQKGKASKATVKRKKKITPQANQQLHSRPINTTCHQAPDYESLTLVELRNAVKKYGFKIKDRQSMIDTLKNIQSFINTNPPSSSIPAQSPPSSSSIQEPPISSDNLTAKHLEKQKFANRVKNDIQLWERILRYENVDLKTCLQGLPQKEKNAYHIYLDENALVYKPSSKKK